MNRIFDCRECSKTLEAIAKLDELLASVLPRVCAKTLEAITPRRHATPYRYRTWNIPNLPLGYSVLRGWNPFVQRASERSKERDGRRRRQEEAHGTGIPSQAHIQGAGPAGQEVRGRGGQGEAQDQKGHGEGQRRRRARLRPERHPQARRAAQLPPPGVAAGRGGGAPGVAGHQPGRVRRAGGHRRLPPRRAGGGQHAEGVAHHGRVRARLRGRRGPGGVRGGRHGREHVPGHARGERQWAHAPGRGCARPRGGRADAAAGHPSGGRGRAAAAIWCVRG
ncbi:myosin heavy chain IB isoform X4 [Selaginella moellendorffii]|uniref:myosin heavy chain IB isoform X4 n=1 Tax=Selaginella moellendorffii TaxID=88036 RepID=UPI000D1C9980|nr:myosin heavy chain IB isoform X4 [Selaginella moellendorffii]|eukprot:XP_024532222.1 myosin heavy chain IB isoform X4 [Selaginella moellendorffii]